MIIVYYLLFPGFLFSAIVGLLTSWFDRKVTARVQWRKGPPWYQNFADVLKLLVKEVYIPETANALIFLLAPAIALGAASLVSAMLGVVNMNWQTTFVGDLIVLWYVLSIPSIMLILGGSASGNPLSSVGTAREINQLIAYELPMAFSLATVVFKVGSISLGDILQYQATNGPILYSISGILACVVMLLCLQAKLGLVPFDTPEAETELGAGILMEYSGAALGAFKLTKAILLYISPVFIITLFWGGIQVRGLGILWAVLKYALFVALFTLIRNTNPRLRIDQVVSLFWVIMLLVSLAGFILMVLGY